VDRAAVDRYNARFGLVLAALASTPGVTAAAVSSHVPLSAPRTDTVVQLHGQSPPVDYRVQRQTVSDGYFTTMGIEIRRGRGFEPGDGSRFAVVVSRKLEREILEGNGVGKRLSVQTGNTSRMYEVIGVVDDVRHEGFVGDEQATVYLPSSGGAPVSHMVVRHAGDAAAVLPRLREAVNHAGRRVIVTRSTTMPELVSASLSEERLRAVLSTAFGGAALLLAAAGLFALVTRMVMDRRHEMGVRVVLGATPARVRAHFLREALRTVALGTAAGVPVAHWLSRMMRGLLPEVISPASSVYGVAIAVLVLAALLAIAAASHRATRLDPSAILRKP
jgi:hypothetical protein